MNPDNRARIARSRAKRQNLRMVQRGVVYLLLDADSDVVLRGDLSAIDAYLVAHAGPQVPGPARRAIPGPWAGPIDLLTAELNAAKRSPGTIRLRVKALASFAVAHPGSDPLTVTRDDLIRYLSDNTWAPRYAHSIRTTFRVFFLLMQDHELRLDNPANRLPHIGIPRSLPRPCPDGAIRHALASISDPRVALAIRVAVETGLRRHEIAKLRRADVEGWPGCYSLRVFGKGGHERMVPITDDLARALRSGTAEHVFPAVDRWGNLGDAHITPHHLGKLISDALPDNWTVHTIRHRFATKAYQATGDLRAVQELLGHSSPATTAIYTQVSDDSMRSAAAAAMMSAADGVTL